jgi:MFS family permease
MRRVLAHREFRLLWLGQAASTLGDRLVIVALALYVDEIGSPSDVGVVLAAHSLPFVLFLLIGGVVADRLPRHRVMVVTDVSRGLLHALLAILIFAGDIEVWQIAAIEVLFGTAEAFFRPAYSGLVPQTVPEEEIQQANAVIGVTNTFSMFLGPALATALVLGLGAGWAFALDALTFAVSAFFLVQMRPRARGETLDRLPMLRELKEGYDAVRERPWVGAILLGATSVLLFVFGPFSTLGPSVAASELGGRGMFGVAMAVFGAGTVAGSMSAARWRPLHPLRIAQASLVPYSLGVALFALGSPVALIVLVFLAGGFGVGLFAVWWETVLAERIPPHLLSRVSAYDWMTSSALLPVAYVLAGPLGEAVGEPEVLLGGALLGVLTELLVLSRPAVWGLKSGRPSSVVEASA